VRQRRALPSPRHGRAKGGRRAAPRIQVVAHVHVHACVLRARNAGRAQAAAGDAARCGRPRRGAH
jgi:hypothetical protein